MTYHHVSVSVRFTTVQTVHSLLCDSALISTTICQDPLELEQSSHIEMSKEKRASLEAATVVEPDVRRDKNGTVLIPTPSENVDDPLVRPNASLYCPSFSFQKLELRVTISRTGRCRANSAYSLLSVCPPTPEM